MCTRVTRRNLTTWKNALLIRSRIIVWSRRAQLAKFSNSQKALLSALYARKELQRVARRTHCFAKSAATVEMIYRRLTNLARITQTNLNKWSLCKWLVATWFGFDSWFFFYLWVLSLQPYNSIPLIFSVDLVSYKLLRNIFHLVVIQPPANFKWKFTILF